MKQKYAKLKNDKKEDKKKCGGCNGTGDCKRCGGSGHEPNVKALVDCRRCGGTGKCSGCNGSGWV